MSALLNKGLLAIPTQNHGECMAAAMLPVIHRAQPNTTLTANDLFVSRASDNSGISITEAALMFRAMGIPSLAISNRISSVPFPTRAFNTLWYMEGVKKDEYFRRMKISLEHLKLCMQQTKAMVICYVDVPSDGSSNDSHAHLITGFTRDHFLYHETRSSKLSRSGKTYIPMATPNSVITYEQLQVDWENHDCHTVIVFPPTESAGDKILAWQDRLKTYKLALTLASLRSQGKPHAHLLEKFGLSDTQLRQIGRGATAARAPRP